MHSLIFALPKNVRLNHCPQNLSFPLRVSRVIMNSTHYFIIKTSNKRELQQIVYNHSSHIDFKDFMNFYKLYSFYVIEVTLGSDNPLRFRKNLLGRI